MTDNLPRLVLYSKFQGATLRRSTPLILVLLTGGRERNQQCTRQEYFSVFDRAAPIVKVCEGVGLLRRQKRRRDLG